jgi:transposase
MLRGMRPHGTPQQLEGRRRRAVALLRAGKTYQSVAATLNASISSVVRWAQGFRRGGAAALRAKPTPGRPPRLSKSQKRRLLQLLERGAGAAGYTTELWTLPRIAKLIEKHFGILYHSGHVWRVMMGLKWTWQKPERRATQRNEQAIARWKKQQWPGLKKSPKTWGPSRISRRKRIPPHP